MNSGDAYFETDPYREHTIRATKAANPQAARVEIRRGDTVVREFVWPAYKVWNIAAHAEEIIDGEIGDAALDLEGADA